MKGLLRRPAIEFNLTAHCNLRCAGCDHAAHLMATAFADPEELETMLAALAPVLRVRELKLLGGEPLLHPQFAEFVEIARASGIAEKIAVVTNGILLHRADPAVLRRVDILRVSVYPAAKIRADLGALGAAARERGARLEIERVSHFRKTLLNRRHEDPLLVGEIYRSCRMAHRWSCHTIHEGRYFPCSPAALFEGRMALLGKEERNREQDGVLLRAQVPDLDAALRRRIARTEPLRACWYCLGTSGALRAHRQVPNRAARASELAPEDEIRDHVALSLAQRLRLWLLSRR